MPEVKAIAEQNLITDEIRKALHVLSGDARDYDPLYKLINGACFCLLDEAEN